VFQRDYLMRIVDQIGQAVGRALGLIAKRKTDEAQQQLDTGYAALGMDRELLLILDGPTLARQLGDDQRIAAAITLLLCDAELQLARSDRLAAQKLLRAASRLRDQLPAAGADVEQAFERVDDLLDG
jgi:hypothetical protein